MAPKRKERVAPPPGPAEWDVRFGNNEAVRGWEELCSQAATNTRRAWEQLRTQPRAVPSTPRQHRLKGELGTNHGYEQWQIEVTGAGRIWYWIDDDKRIVWVVVHAGTGHPKATE